MPKEDASETNRLLKVIARLLAYQIAGSQTVAKGAPVLDRLGLEAAEIAAVFDTTANAVSARLGEAKKKKTKKTKIDQAPSAS